MIKFLSVFQISLLVLSLLSFNLLISINFISAENTVAVVENGMAKPVTESYAEKHGLAIFEDPIDAATASKTTTSSITTPSTLRSITGFGEGAEAYEAGADVNILAQGGFIDGLVSSLSWAAIVYAGVSMIGSLLGVDDEKVSAAATAAAAGTLVGRGAALMFDKVGALGGTGIGLAVAAIVFALTYKDTEIEVVLMESEAWDATTGGKYCEKCNNGILPCSEYQCRSLGQACQIVNPDTDEAKCVWVNQNDVNYPIIEAWDNALLADYVYKPDSAISPPDRGVIIWNNNEPTGCADAYTRLSFGVTLDEPAKCKIDYLRKNSFEDMTFDFGGSSLLRYNHSQAMSLPGPNSESNLTLENDGNYAVYVRCQDANGNANIANFVFRFCVNPGPDTTAPLIVSTNLLNGMPVAYGQTELDLELYVNEPSECRWDHLDRNYNDMENNLSCATNAYEMNAQMLYTCTTTLNGLKDDYENDFYFRCKDQPTKPEDERNTNSESYEFIVMGTQPLVIDEVGPNKTISDSTDVIQITLAAETSAGWEDGRALCYYSTTGEEEDYILFYETDSYEHAQDLWLPAGDYTYYIKCVDLGGNSDVAATSFTVESDSAEPLAVRAYHEGSYLKIITNEDATCVYDTVDCTYNFDDGIEMASKDNMHYTKWNTELSFYIKCADEYGNEPAPDKCSIIARPFGL